MKILKAVGLALAMSCGAFAAHSATWTEDGTCSVTATTPDASDCFGLVSGNIQSQTSNSPRNPAFLWNTDTFVEAGGATYTGLLGYQDWDEIQRDGDFGGGPTGMFDIVANSYESVVVLLKSSREWSAYLFDGGLSDITISYATDNDRGLSNYLVLGRGEMSEVPLPAAGFLLLGGLGALGLMRRRKTA